MITLPVYIHVIVMASDYITSIHTCYCYVIVMASACISSSSIRYDQHCIWCNLN